MFRPNRKIKTRESLILESCFIGWRSSFFLFFFFFHDKQLERNITEEKKKTMRHSLTIRCADNDFFAFFSLLSPSNTPSKSEMTVRWLYQHRKECRMIRVGYIESSLKCFHFRECGTTFNISSKSKNNNNKTMRTNRKKQHQEYICLSAKRRICAATNKESCVKKKITICAHIVNAIDYTIRYSFFFFITNSIAIDDECEFHSYPNDSSNFSLYILYAMWVKNYADILASLVELNKRQESK